jgi:hypothetical protein
MRNVSDEFVEKIKKPILCSKRFSEICAVYEIIWKKNSRTGQATDDSMTQAYCTLDT